VAEHQPDPPVAVIILLRSTAMPSSVAATTPSQRDHQTHMIRDKGHVAWQRATGYCRRSHAEMVCLQTINSA